MTIDEAIKHCLEVAEQKEHDSITTTGDYELDIAMKEGCIQCAADHRQLAEWLTNYKEAIRLLNEAVLAFRIMGEDIDCHFNYLCEKCPLNNNNDWCEWKYQDEALKLIGGRRNDTDM